MAVNDAVVDDEVPQANLPVAPVIPEAPRYRVPRDSRSDITNAVAVFTGRLRVTETCSYKVTRLNEHWSRAVCLSIYQINII